MDKVVEAILKYGLIPTFLLLFIFLIIQDPNRAYKLKGFFIGPFFRLFKWFKREYVANEVVRNLNTFFSKEMYGDNFAFKINWIKHEDNAILKSGKLVIRMRREDDQTKNILTAAKYALPKIVCPIMRHSLKQSFVTAIDYTFLHKLADKLGNHGKAVYKRYFLNPEVEANPEVAVMLQKLLRLDKFGLFTSIFINELDNVGEGLYADGDTQDRTNEMLQFTNYLGNVAERGRGDEIELMNMSEVFKVSIILLAKSQIASKRGLIPYLRRLNLNLEKGCDSIYIIAFPPAFNFLNKFISAIDGNQRVSINKIYKTKESYYHNNDGAINICCLRRNKLFTNESFVRKIEASDIKIGKLVNGTVIDCSTDEALISFLGVDGTIRKMECSWLSHVCCTDILSVGETYTFIIKDIDTSNGNISLSLRLPDTDPWKLVVIPAINENIFVKIVCKDNVFYKCSYLDLVEVYIPIDEMSWWPLNDEEKINQIGKTIETRVTKVDNENRIIVCSKRVLEVDPWPEIHANLAVGSEFNGKIQEVNENFVRVNFANNLSGKIGKESLLKAGHEYSRYTENLVVGQGIDVVVTKVFINKRYIKLELKRNIT